MPTVDVVQVANQIGNAMSQVITDVEQVIGEEVESMVRRERDNPKIRDYHDLIELGKQGLAMANLDDDMSSLHMVLQSVIYDYGHMLDYSVHYATESGYRDMDTETVTPDHPLWAELEYHRNGNSSYVLYAFVDMTADSSVSVELSAYQYDPNTESWTLIDESVEVGSSVELAAPNIPALGETPVDLAEHYLRAVLARLADEDPWYIPWQRLLENNA